MRAAQRLHLVWVLAMIGLVSAECSARTAPVQTPSEQSEQSRTEQASSTQQAKDLDQAIRILSGTWKLRERTNPDGSAMQWEGTTIIDLKPYYPHFEVSGTMKALAPRALGTITVYETGIHDPKCPDCVPEEFLGKRGHVEANGTWIVSLLPEDHKLYASKGDEFYISVFDTTRIGGDHTPVEEGWNQNAVAYYRIPRGGDSAELLNQVGADFFSPNNLPTNNQGETLSQEMLAASDCNVAAMSVTGDRMNIKWTWGGTDEWVRVDR